MLIVLILAVFITAARGQRYVVDILAEDKAAEQAISRLAGRSYPDSVTAVAAMQQVLSRLVSEGHLLASYGRVTWSTDSVAATLAAGPKQLVYLVEEGQRGRRPISPAQLLSQSALDVKLNGYLNNGYPFARLAYGEAATGTDTLLLSVSVTPGPAIRFDTLRLSGQSKTRTKFLQKYLFISTGTPYSERAVQGIVSRVNGSGYLEAASVPAVDFFKEKAAVTLAIRELEVNQIDGVLGFLPAQNTETGKLLITGQVETDLYNLFGTGQHFSFNWQNFNVASQRLRLVYDHPVVLGSPIDFHGSFQQLKQDSTFVTRAFYTGFSVPLAYRWELRFGVDFLRNSLLSTTAITPGERLIQADSRLNQYKAGLAYNGVNDIVLPTKGLRVGVDIGYGQKEINRNRAIDDIAYEGIMLSTPQTTLQASLENYTEVFRSSVFVQQFNAGAIINDELFRNDLFRLGGFTRLRGFNENQFFARRFAVGVLEWRLRFDEGSYLLSFVDQSVQSPITGSWLYAAGFGSGLVLKVRSGLFRLMAGWGWASDGSAQLAQPKIHFGFVNRF